MKLTKTLLAMMLALTAVLPAAHAQDLSAGGELKQDLNAQWGPGRGPGWGHGPGHGPGWGHGPGHGPGGGPGHGYPPPPPNYPPPPPSYPPPPPTNGGLCQGSFNGIYSNGVPGVFVLNGYQLTIYLQGGYVFNGSVDCRQYNWDNAQLYFQADGGLNGQGTINLRDGRVYLQISQNNGLSFNGSR